MHFSPGWRIPRPRPRIREETLAKVALIGGWDNVMVTSVGQRRRPAGRRQAAGLVRRIARQRSIRADGGLLTRNRGSVGMVGFAMSEENLERILAHPLGMVCSDGGSFAIEGPARRGQSRIPAASAPIPECSANTCGSERRSRWKTRSAR